MVSWYVNKTSENYKRRTGQEIPEWFQYAIRVFFKWSIVIIVIMTALSCLSIWWGSQ